MDVKKCTVCNIGISKDKYEKDGNICKHCYNNNKKIYKNNKEKIQVVNSVNNTNINIKNREVVDSAENNNN